MQKKNEHAFFVVKRTKLKKLLRQLRGNVVNKKARYRTTCDLTILHGLISFNVPGATFGMEAQTGGIAKTSFDLNMFYSILSTYRKTELRIVLEKDKMIIDKFTCPAGTSFFENDKIFRSRIPPVNYSELELLGIAAKYTIEELEFNNLWILVNQAEGRLRSNVGMAASALEPYGITSEDIQEFVGIRIQNALKSMEKSLGTQDKIPEGMRVSKKKQ